MTQFMFLFFKSQIIFYQEHKNEAGEGEAPGAAGMQHRPSVRWGESLWPS